MRVKGAIQYTDIDHAIRTNKEEKAVVGATYRSVQSTKLSLLSSELGLPHPLTRRQMCILCNGWEHYVPYRCL